MHVEHDHLLLPWTMLVIARSLRGHSGAGFSLENGEGGKPVHLLQELERQASR